MDNFDEYLAKIDDAGHRERMTELLNWVHVEYPELEPEVKWSQPMFTNQGTYIIGFSTAKQHLAVAPEKACLDRFTADIKKAGYSQTQQLMRIKWTEPVDYSLLGDMIGFNITDKAGSMSFWRKE